MRSEDLFLRPGWAAGGRVRALMSTRRGGSGVAPFDSFNLALHGSDPAVADNRERFARVLGARPVWLHQVHGTEVALLTDASPRSPTTADAAVTATPGVACTVLVADCLPVLLSTVDGTAVGAAHAGWRGLAAGVLERTVATLCSLAGCAPDEVQAWLGPCIGAGRFEVGADVLQAFGRDPAGPVDERFQRADRADGSQRWLADLHGLARERLRSLGVQRIEGGHWCTYDDESAFFSFRRDARHGPTGRMAAAIAIG